MLQCPECPKVLRITVTTEMYGKTGNVNCVCGARLRVTIPVPPESVAPAAPSGFPFGEAFGDVFGDIFGPKKK